MPRPLFDVGRDTSFGYLHSVLAGKDIVQGDIWALHNIFARYRGNELSHYELELIQLHRQSMGSRAYYNPFAWTYELEVDKPYAKYVLDFDNLFDEIGVDGSSENPSLALAGS